VYPEPYAALSVAVCPEQIVLFEHPDTVILQFGGLPALITLLQVFEQPDALVTVTE